jgi:hypothetical protein
LVTKYEGYYSITDGYFFRTSWTLER